MDKNILKALWAGLFILCAALGFVPEPEGFTLVLMVGLAVLFFVPPYWLLWQAKQNKDAKELRFLRNVSILSLSVTFVLMVANLLSVLAPTWVGNVLYWALVICATPMMCSRVALLSLLAWAVLLFTGMEFLGKLRKEGKA